jgi:beta-carotene 3-hydroxylase
MHGFAMDWHRSHHAPPLSRFEKNDLFPVCFSAVGVLLFALGSGGWRAFWWVGVGVTAYGAAYLFVHEVYIHHRLNLPRLRNPYFEWLRNAHRDHHTSGREPYGMLLPLVRDRSEGRSDRDPVDRERV